MILTCCENWTIWSIIDHIARVGEGGTNGQRTEKKAATYKSLRRSLDPVFGVDSGNQGFGSPFTDSGRALTKSSVFGASNLELAARGHIPWLYEPYFRNQRRKLVPCAGQQDFSTQYHLCPHAGYNRLRSKPGDSVKVGHCLFKSKGKCSSSSVPEPHSSISCHPRISGPTQNFRLLDRGLNIVCSQASTPRPPARITPRRTGPYIPR